MAATETKGHWQGGNESMDGTHCCIDRLPLLRLLAVQHRYYLSQLTLSTTTRGRPSPGCCPRVSAAPDNRDNHIHQISKECASSKLCRKSSLQSTHAKRQWRLEPNRLKQFVVNGILSTRPLWAHKRRQTCSQAGPGRPRIRWGPAQHAKADRWDHGVIPGRVRRPSCCGREARAAGSQPWGRRSRFHRGF